MVSSKARTGANRRPAVCTVLTEEYRLKAQTQGRNIRHYSNYLAERARAYRDTKCDWVRGKESRLEKLSVDKGLLRETEVVQHQLTALLKCDVRSAPPDNTRGYRSGPSS